MEDFPEAVEVLLGSPYKIGLSLVPVSSTDKLVEVEGKDVSPTITYSDNSVEYVDELSNSNGAFELAKVSFQKLLLDECFSETN